MTNIWPLAVAQKQLRALIDRAATGQAQIITTQGQPTVVVLSYAEYQRLTAPALLLLEFFQTCPLEAGEELDITRDRSGLRPLASQPNRMRGFVVVDEALLDDVVVIADWIARAQVFNRTLPPK